MSDDTILAVRERQDGEPWQDGNRSRRWYVPVMFTLEDGREVQSNHYCVKGEVAEYVALLPRDIKLPLLVDSIETTLALMPLDHHG